MELIYMGLTLLCTVVQTVCFVILAFELSPWRRKDKDGN
jgi:hypothetical protein